MTHPSCALLPLDEPERYYDTCMTPGCRDDAGHGVTGAFCAYHAAVLARVRDEYESEDKTFRVGSHRKHVVSQVEHRYSWKSLDAMMDSLLAAA